MKQNLGKLDRIFRLVVAVWWLGPDPFALPFGWWWIVFVVAWIALIESFVGYCWLHDLFHINNKSQ